MRPRGQLYALARCTVTLISSSAAQCVHQRLIPLHNEIGAMPELLEELHRAYQHSLTGRDADHGCG
jgi:hypothetical protein